MPHTRKTVPLADRTPQAQLSEGVMHGIVGYQLAQASIVTDQVFDERVARRGDVRQVELTLLALVQANPDVTARQLSRALGVTPPNVALWLDRLASRGLVARERSAADARMQHIRITRAGAALVELLHKVALARRAG